MAIPKPRRAPLLRWRRRDHLAASLAASLALHALILSLQFGVSGLGLSVLGVSRTERRASIPTLQAILREPKESSTTAVQPQPPAPAEHTIATIRVQPRTTGENHFKGQAARAQLEAGVRKGDIGAVKKVPAPPDTKEKLDLAAENPEQPLPSLTDRGAAILATDKESSWSTSTLHPNAGTSVATATQESEEKARNERIELEKANEAEARERARIEQAENQRKAELAAIARAAAEAAERQRIEEGNRAAEQAAQAKARLEAVERTRLEEEKRKTEQTAVLRAREDSLARKVEAEALEQARQLAAQSDPAGDTRKPQDDRGTTSSSGVAGKADATARPQPDKGGSLASRALDQARSGLPGAPIRQPAPIDGPRRGSILGRDPKDIQLAFYGEGWRQKVERIGSLNYPRISKNRHYDPLVVTVSINSDGTLAGVRIERSSGHKEIDDAVRRIVEMSAPFAAFPPDLRRSYDVVDITRTWNFLEERPRIFSQ